MDGYSITYGDDPGASGIYHDNDLVVSDYALRRLWDTTALDLCWQCPSASRLAYMHKITAEADVWVMSGPMRTYDDWRKRGYTQV